MQQRDGELGEKPDDDDEPSEMDAAEVAFCQGGL